MAQVTVTIAGRVYRMACGDGEEAHIEALAQSVDGKIAELRGSFGEIGDQRIVVMAALTFADEVSELRRRLAEAEFDLTREREATAALSSQNAAWGEQVAAALGEAATRIEAAAAGARNGG